MYVPKWKEAWTLVCESYNNDGHVGLTPREVTQLRNLWDLLKKVVKKESAEEIRERRKTGGGSFTNPMSVLSQRIKEIIPDQINPPILLENICDSDATSNEKFKNDNPPVIVSPEIAPSTEVQSDDVVPSKSGKRTCTSINQSEYFASILDIMRKENSEKMIMKRQEHEIKMKILGKRKKKFKRESSRE